MTWAFSSFVDKRREGPVFVSGARFGSWWAHGGHKKAKTVLAGDLAAHIGELPVTGAIGADIEHSGLESGALDVGHQPSGRPGSHHSARASPLLGGWPDVGNAARGQLAPWKVVGDWPAAPG
jgi:hypothetical protein